MAARCECGKRTYPSEPDALAAACRCAHRFGGSYRVYRCLVDRSAWHLTTKPLRTWVRAATRKAN